VIDTYVEVETAYAERYASAPISEKLKLYKDVLSAARQFNKLANDSSLSEEERQYYNDAKNKVDQMFD